MNLKKLDGMPVQMHQLTFLQEMKQICGERIIRNIEEFECKDIILNK